MALEQMQLFLAGRLQEELGEIKQLEPDSYPLLANSELQSEHQTISELIQTAGRGYDRDEIRGNKTLRRMCETGSIQRTRYALALIERCFAYDAKLIVRENWHHSGFFDYGPAAEAIAMLFDHGVDANQVVGPILEWFGCYRFNYYATPVVERVVDWAIQTYVGTALPDDLRRQFISLRGQFSDVDYTPAQTFMALQKRTSLLKYPEDEWLESHIDSLIGTGPWAVLVPCEYWTENTLEQLEQATSDEREHWLALLRHCQTASSAKPSTRWLKQGHALQQAVGESAFTSRVVDWLPRVNEGRIRPTIGMSWENVDEQQRMHEINATVLRGLLWLCPRVAQPELIRTIGRLTFSCFRKIRGLGPRAVKVGNAGVYALSQINDPLAVGQLALLKVKVKFGSAQKEIEKAFILAAERSGLPREELEEMSVPNYGLTDVGVCEEKLGDFTARLKVIGTDSTELVWLKPDGKTQRSVPASLKAAHADELKELQAAAKDIQRMLPAQRERIDGLFLQQRTWPLVVWRERYLDHPLVGSLARRILWEFTTGAQTTAGIWFNGSLVDLELKPIELVSSGVTVRLWHPIGKDTKEIAAWRGWLETHRIQQPFKQAHREIYLLTDAERRTRTYSNRYAAHIIKQHQFNALCALRGWKNQLRLMVDAEYAPPCLRLPQWNLRAEFWVEGIGTDYGNDTNETGTYLRLSTDQVRFYRMDAAQRAAHAGGGGYQPGYRGEDAEPLPLEEIPPLVFSEVMRDVDLFVGVASVGNDPTWNDGGPEGRYRDYWQNYSFGDLNATAKTRKDVLQRLVPKLKIASQCSFEDKFLVVKGSLRTYKIHLGSGNIQMEPNNQYLCIVPKQGVSPDSPVLLPFEGDRTLSVIISKAFLLANDAKIKDSSIVSQIKQS